MIQQCVGLCELVDWFVDCEVFVYGICECLLVCVVCDQCGQLVGLFGCCIVGDFVFDYCQFVVVDICVFVCCEIFVVICVLVCVDCYCVVFDLVVEMMWQYGIWYEVEVVCELVVVDVEFVIVLVNLYVFELLVVECFDDVCSWLIGSCDEFCGLCEF